LPKKNEENNNEKNWRLSRSGKVICGRVNRNETLGEGLQPRKGHHLIVNFTLTVTLTLTLTLSHQTQRIDNKIQV